MEERFMRVPHHGPTAPTCVKNRAAAVAYNTRNSRLGGHGRDRARENKFQNISTRDGEKRDRWTLDTGTHVARLGALARALAAV